MYKTYYRIATRFWWPSMAKDVKEAVESCASCNIANAVSHTAQKIYQAISTAEPLEICGLDVWCPGTTKPTDAVTTSARRNKGDQKAVLTYVCTLTAFAQTAFLHKTDSTTVARTAFGQCFVPNGMPKLILMTRAASSRTS